MRREEKRKVDQDVKIFFNGKRRKQDDQISIYSLWKLMK